MKVIKKDGTLEEFDGEKIVNAVNKSASRVMITLDDTAFHEIVGAVLEVIEEKGLTDIPVAVMHNIVEQVLDKYDPRIATIVSDIWKDITGYFQKYLTNDDGTKKTGIDWVNKVRKGGYSKQT